MSSKATFLGTDLILPGTVKLDLAVRPDGLVEFTYEQTFDDPDLVTDFHQVLTTGRAWGPNTTVDSPTPTTLRLRGTASRERVGAALTFDFLAWTPLRGSEIPTTVLRLAAGGRMDPADAVAEALRPVTTDPEYPLRGLGPFPRGEGRCPFCGRDHGVHTPAGPDLYAGPSNGPKRRVSSAEYASKRRALLRDAAYRAPELSEVRIGLLPGTFIAWVEHSMRRVEECEGQRFEP